MFEDLKDPWGFWPENHWGFSPEIFMDFDTKTSRISTRNRWVFEPEILYDFISKSQRVSPQIFETLIDSVEI